MKAAGLAAEEAALKAWAEKRARQRAAAKAAAAALKRRAAKQASNAVFAESSTEKRVEKVTVPLTAITVFPTASHSASYYRPGTYCCAQCLIPQYCIPLSLALEYCTQS